VTSGQRLAVVESRVLGDPPPTVTVTAPMAGIIETRNVVLGQAVEPNTQIFRISDRPRWSCWPRCMKKTSSK